MKKNTSNLDDWRNDPHNSFGPKCFFLHSVPSWHETDSDSVVRDDDRPPLIVGLEWSARIVTVGLEFALPTLGGWWLDRRWGTEWLWIAGAVLGMVVGGTHLIQMVMALSRQGQKHSPGEDG